MIKLLELIAKIRSGNYQKDDIYTKQNTYPRQEYKSPRELSGYNYGYMTSGEMDANNR